MTTNPPLDRAARRRDQTHNQLVAAARKLMSANSVADLRIRDITEEADVGQGSFYNHFESKDAIVEVVTRQTIEQLAATVLNELDHFEDAAQAAAFATRRFITFARRDPETARLWINLTHADSIFEEAVRPYARVPLESGVTQGRFTIANIDMALIVLTSSALAVIRLILDDQAPIDAEMLHAEAMLTLFGLTPDEAASVARAKFPPY